MLSSRPRVGPHAQVVSDRFWPCHCVCVITFLAPPSRLQLYRQLCNSTHLDISTLRTPLICTLRSAPGCYDFKLLLHRPSYRLPSEERNSSRSLCRRHRPTCMAPRPGMLR